MTALAILLRMSKKNAIKVYPSIFRLLLMNIHLHTLHPESKTKSVSFHFLRCYSYCLGWYASQRHINLFYTTNSSPVVIVKKNYVILLFFLLLSQQQHFPLKTFSSMLMLRLNFAVSLVFSEDFCV